MDKDLGLTQADYEALRRELIGIIPATAPKDFPEILRRTVELGQLKLKVSPEEIQVEIVGNVVSRIVSRHIG